MEIQYLGKKPGHSTREVRKQEEKIRQLEQANLQGQKGYTRGWLAKDGGGRDRDINSPRAAGLRLQQVGY